MSFLLFAGDEYYPMGGANDFKSKHETIDDAISAHDPTEHNYDGGWANIFCLDQLKIVATFDRSGWAIKSNESDMTK